MTRTCRWYRGTPKGFFNTENLSRPPAVVDYQVLGTTYGGLAVVLGVKDVLPVMLNARGCAHHIRYTEYTWGPAFALTATIGAVGKYTRRELPPEMGKVGHPIPALSIDTQDMILGKMAFNPEQLASLKRFILTRSPSLLVFFPGDVLMLTGVNLEMLQEQLMEDLSTPCRIIRLTGLMGANPWHGYDCAMGLLYDAAGSPPIADIEREGVNIIGWRWPTREANYDIGACLQLLKHLNVKVHRILPGGASLHDFSDSLQAKVNLLWCTSFIGSTLQRLERDHGLTIAGRIPPYGFSGTLAWIAELADALEDNTLSLRAERYASRYEADLKELKSRLHGKHVCVIGGPGRLVGLLHAIADFEMTPEALCLWWNHPDGKTNLKQALERFPKEPNIFIVSPSLHEIEEIARDVRPDVWLGGYEEVHACRRYGIPFVPTTVYPSSHQGFDGCIRLGSKIAMALDGHDFTEDPLLDIDMPPSGNL